MNEVRAPRRPETELTDLSAVDLQALLRYGEVSATEVLDAHLARIAERNPVINAVCSVSEDRARAEARRADDRMARGEYLGPLHGLPILHKDLIETAGVRTTFGSAAYRDHVPDQDALIVRRAADAGAVMLGKTNTPQFGTGGHTWNALFGTTVNPYDTTRSAGGSSGGSAAALAAGMAPLATGTDMAGSLRIPAAFCNVVGMRPSPGRVPWVPSRMGWFPYVVPGPMARTVNDLALLLSVTAGPDARAAISIEERGDRFTPPLNAAVSKLKVAWAPGIAGLPVDADVRPVLEQLGGTLCGLGAEVVEAEPDLTGAEEAFLTWRSWYYATSYGTLLRERPEVLDEFTAANTRAGLAVSGEDLGRAEVLRTALHLRMADFFAEYDILVMPCVPVAPFGADSRHPETLGDAPVVSYLDWMRHLYYITATGLPVVSLPAGFTERGLPVGVQIVAGPRRDLDALRFARALETATGFGAVRPGDTAHDSARKVLK
ncbi:amidase family protein [Streptosporangium sp. NBC_01810]|uniref:amidase n=1 Tax=Streptosporangium sp. NBC_01810 TaxID=2975951 RepID=UPI002DD8C56D|nr:amidase family protein [Streptosporangium sp. NBC_01810]WSA27912.1 amidase family protein [Streptosporangium sp. NBC_01810]